MVQERKGSSGEKKEGKASQNKAWQRGKVMFSIPSPKPRSRSVAVRRLTFLVPPFISCRFLFQFKYRCADVHIVSVPFRLLQPANLIQYLQRFTSASISCLARFKLKLTPVSILPFE